MDSDSSNSAKPLFAAGAGLFPSANFSGPSSCEAANKETNDLESLQLDIAPSTLDAIFAVQTANSEKSFPPSHLSSSDESLEPFLTLSDHSKLKRKLSSSEDEKKSLDDESSKRKKKKKKEKQRSTKKKKHKEKKCHSRSPSPQRPSVDIKKIAKDKVFLDDIPDLSPEDAFRLDRKSNRDLYNYKSVSKFHIAKYKPFCYSCLGNEDILLPHSQKEEKSEKKKSKKLADTRYFGKTNRKQSWRKGSVCSSHSAAAKIENAVDFISIPKMNEDEDSTRVVGSYKCTDIATALFVQGKGKEDESDRHIEDTFIMDEIFEKVGRMNQQTREDPTNIDLWLKFVNFQDELARKDKGFKYSPTSLRDVFQPPRSVIEKKLSILEKAIELNPSSLELKKAQLELYQDIWESDKVEKAWEDLLFVHASNIDLWCHYLLRQQARLSTFTFTRVLKKYHRCFKTLIPILEGHVKVVNKSENLEEKLIGLFHQYCNFLHQCGYTERAVSAFQALIEFNLFCPPSLNLEMSASRKAKFEPFWESNAPKFGDSQASGWAKWEDRKQSSSYPSLSSLGSTDELEDSILQENLPKFQTWLKIEDGRQAAHLLPWRPDETKGEQEDDCEDPDRLIVFDDISPSLFIVSKSENCVKIVCLFLSFLGLRSTYLNKVLYEIRDPVFSQYCLEKMHQIPHFSSLKSGLDIGLKWTPQNSLIVFIREVIVQAEMYFSSSTRILFTLLRLDFEVKKTGAIDIHEISKASSKEIKKYGKNLLKESQNRNNLTIWDSFIRLSWVVSDKMEETASMVDVALGMFLDSSAMSDPDKSVGLLLLCRTFSQIMLNFEPLEHIKMKGRRTAPNSEDKLQVMGCLGALVDGSKFKPHGKVDMSSARILKIRKRFDALLQQCLDAVGTPSYVYDKLVALVECSSLFEYCASGFQSANEIFTRVQLLIKDVLSTHSGIDNEKKDSLLLEELYKAHISFIMNVMGVDTISLVHLRTVLNGALLDCPHEFFFHYIFIEIESSTHIAGRLRKFYEKNLRQVGHISTTLFAVLSEVMRHHAVMKTINLSGVMQPGISDSGLLHRIRTLCEHCFHPKVGGHCPLLWRLALTFEATHGDMNRAKGILYRALQNCPWSKSIYVDGVALFGEAELQEMNDLMTEKEIRVRIPLEEVDLLLTAEKQSDGECEQEDDTEPQN